MTTFWLYILVVLSSPSSEEWQGSIKAGDHPVYAIERVYNRQDECLEAKTEAVDTAKEAGETLLVNSCTPHTYNREAKGA